MPSITSPSGRIPVDDYFMLVEFFGLMKKQATRIAGIICFTGGLLVALFFGFYDYLRGDVNDAFGSAQKLGVFLGIALLLLGGNYAFGSFWRYAFLLLFATGVFLSALNIYGEFLSLRNPSINEGIQHFNILRKPQKSPRQVSQEIDKSPDESMQDYAYRLTDLVYSETVHKWEDVVDYTEYNHQVPPHENYLIWALSYLKPNYRFYQFCDPYKAIERGVMICSQVTEAMANQWRTTGMEARNMVLEGHVVAEVEVDSANDTWWILDADFGVVLEHDIKTLEEHPEIVIDKYMKAGYNLEIAERIAGFYGKDGNYIQSNTGICRVEERLYRLKWLIPIALLLPSMIYFGAVWWKERRFPV